MYKTKYMLDYGVKENHVIINTITGAIDIIDNKVKCWMDALNTNTIEDGSIDEETKIVLKQRGYIFDSINDEKALICKVEDYSNKIKEEDICNEFIILPSLGCNLRCTYCFESTDQHIKFDTMKNEDLEAILDYIYAVKNKYEQNHKMKKLFSIRIFGGEPLLPQNNEIVKRILAFSYENNIRVNIVTNGTIIEPYLDLLKEYIDIVYLQITLDGAKNIHDERRIRADGSGTFNEITKNINRLLDENFKINIRINVDKDNIYELAALEHIAEENGWNNNENAIIYASPVLDFSGKSDSILQEHELIEALVDRGYVNSDSSFIKSVVSPCIGFLNMFFDPNKENQFCKTSYCGATSKQELCFSPDGKITTCLTYCGKNKFDVGTFDKNGICIDEEKYKMWTDRTVFRIKGCLDCKYVFLCGGGCAAMALDTNGEIDNKVCSDIKETINSFMNKIIISKLEEDSFL